MARRKISTDTSSALSRVALIGELRMLLGQALDPETEIAIATIRKDSEYSAKVAFGMRYLDPTFVRHSMTEFEKLSLERLQDWLDRRSVWVVYIEGVKNRLDLCAGLPVCAVKEFGFLPKYRFERQITGHVH